MLEPNADDPLNKEAAQLMSTDKRQFERTVRETFKGRTMMVGSQQYTFEKFN
jgi:ubiquitin-protein ligase